MSRRHHCHALGCTTATSPTLLMCSKHWALVPTELRMPVVQFYQRGQCDGRVQLDPRWLLAANRARHHVAMLEGRTDGAAWLDKVAEAIQARIDRTPKEAACT